MDQASGLRKIVDTKVSVLKKKRGVDCSINTDRNNAPRVVSVTSGKGGVGKTNIVGNLAMAFTQLGKKVLVLDADLGLANIDIIFGIHPEYNIGHVIRGEMELPEIMVEGPEGIKIIPAGSGISDLTGLTEGQKLNLLSEFEALEGNLDVFLIDTGAGISSNVIYFNVAADECIVVATPEPTSITDAYAMMKVMFKEHYAKHFKLLVNMVDNDKEAKAVYMKLNNVAERFLSGIFIEYIGYVPSDDLLKKAVRNRKTVMELYPSATSSKKFNRIARDFLKSQRRNDSEGNIKFFLNRFMEYSA